MKLDIILTPAMEPYRKVIMETMWMVYGQGDLRTQVTWQMKKIGMVIMVDAPRSDEDSVTVKLTTRGYRHYCTGVER